MNQPIGERDFFFRVRSRLPASLKDALRPAWVWTKAVFFRVKYGFPPPPYGTDLVGYEAFFELFKSKDLLSVPGDIVEIGAFCGGGTYKLAKFLVGEESRKKVYAIDIFEPSIDGTANVSGFQMATLYHKILKGRSQEQVFQEVTNGLDNIVTLAEDSARVNLPTNAVCFAFIDGNHSSEYVKNDFYLVWSKLSPGGVAAFHDYGWDLPNVTATIDQLCTRHRTEISELQVDQRRHVIFVQKRSI